MGDLFLDDVADETSYSSAEILQDIRRLIGAGYREGQVLDYKADLSPKDNWPEAVAAFANSFGGLIIFGVQGKGDQARRFTGYDPQGKEVRTQIANTILSRIQPRPDFSLRVVTFDEDPTKEVALLRVQEGLHPPYMHSKEEERQVYIRSDARKVAADYLQLKALFEKGQQQAAVIVNSTKTIHSLLSVEEPQFSNISTHLYRWSIAPYGDGANRRLTSGIERKFYDAAACAFPGLRLNSTAERNRNISILKHTASDGRPQKFAITPEGVLGFVKVACIRTQNGLAFYAAEFCAELSSFLILGAEYYRSIGFYGDTEFTFTIVVAPDALEHKPVTFRNHRLPATLFEPELQVVRPNFTTNMRLSLYPILAGRIEVYTATIMNELARECGSVLSPDANEYISLVTADALAGDSGRASWFQPPVDDPHLHIER